jgi:hypothetical protein
VRRYYDHPRSLDTPPGDKTEWAYDQGTDVFKIVRNSDGLSFYRNNVFLDRRLAGSSPLLPDPMPPLYPAVLGVFEFNSPASPNTWSGILNAQSCAALEAAMVRVSQLATEVMVPFTEGNTTAAGVTTERFDAGEGSEWWIVAPIVDSGNELRSKVIKPARVNGRLTNASLMIYTWDVTEGINIADLEAGVNSITGPCAIPDSTNVAQSELVPVNCPNAVLHTIRVEGDDRGQSVRDQVHEILYQQALQGVRR